MCMIRQAEAAQKCTLGLGGAATIPTKLQQAGLGQCRQLSGSCRRRQCTQGNMYAPRRLRKGRRWQGREPPGAGRNAGGAWGVGVQGTNRGRQLLCMTECRRGRGAGLPNHSAAAWPTHGRQLLGGRSVVRAARVKRIGDGEYPIISDLTFRCALALGLGGHAARLGTQSSWGSSRWDWLGLQHAACALALTVRGKLAAGENRMLCATWGHRPQEPRGAIVAYGATAVAPPLPPRRMNGTCGCLCDSPCQGKYNYEYAIHTNLPMMMPIMPRNRTQMVT